MIQTRHPFVSMLRTRQLAYMAGEQTHISIKWKEETNQDLVAKSS